MCWGTAALTVRAPSARFSRVFFGMPSQQHPLDFQPGLLCPCCCQADDNGVVVIDDEHRHGMVMMAGNMAGPLS